MVLLCKIHKKKEEEKKRITDEHDNDGTDDEIMPEPQKSDPALVLQPPFNAHVRQKSKDDLTLNDYYRHRNEPQLKTSKFADDDDDTSTSPTSLVRASTQLVQRKPKNSKNNNKQHSDNNYVNNNNDDLNSRMLQLQQVPMQTIDEVHADVDSDIDLAKLNNNQLFANLDSLGKTNISSIQRARTDVISDDNSINKKNEKKHKNKKIMTNSTNHDQNNDTSSTSRFSKKRHSVPHIPSHLMVSPVRLKNKNTTC